AAIISFRTEVRNHLLTRMPLLLFTIDANLVARQRDFDLIRRNAWQFDADTNRICRFTNVSRWFEGGQRRQFDFCGFAQNRIEFADSLGKLLEFDSFETGCAYALNHTAPVLCALQRA